MLRSVSPAPASCAALGWLAALVPPQSPALGGAQPDFPALLWIADQTPSQEGEELARLVGGRVVARQAAAPAQGDWLVFNAAGRNELHLDWESAFVREQHERWMRERTDELLVRRPCLNDPGTLARLADTLAESLGLERQSAVGVALGDEVTLTPSGSPMDWCLCDHCQREWLRWCQTRGLTGLGSLQDHATDRVLEALEQGHTRAISGWLARRKFHHDSVARALESLALQSRCLAPGVPVGVLGLPGQSAFGNLSVSRALGWADFVEPYRTGDATALAFALRQPAQHVYATVFLDPKWPALGVWRAWEHALRGGDGVFLWSSEQLAIDPDLNQGPSAGLQLAQALADIRGARAALGGWRPRASGVALLHSFESMAVSWLLDAQLDGTTWPRRLSSYQDAHGTLEASLTGWIQLFEDLGLMPGALELEHLEPSATREHPLLIANQLVVLDETDLARLERYLEGGGHLLISGKFGHFDGALSRRPQEWFQSWSASFGDRVRRFDDDPKVYRKLRQDQDRAARSWRERGRGWANWAGIESSHFRPRGAAGDIPWLSASRQEFAEGNARCVCVWALPAKTAADGSPPADLLLELDVPVGWRAEWIVPGPAGPVADSARELKSGQAAVLRFMEMDKVQPDPQKP